MDLQLLAAQLRKPVGEEGKQIGDVMNNGNKLINEWTIAELDLQEFDYVLEIGMGNGYFVKDILVKPGIRYEGIDYSEIMIGEATKMNHSFIEENKVHFTLATANKMPFADDTFTKIFAVNTIYFWGDAAKELQEIKRVLQSGGRFVLSIRNKESMQHMPFTEYGFVKYTCEELTDVLAKNGFKVINVLEQKEPIYNFNGQSMQLENIIVSCTK
jgi:ubiquinone/menaquinone biosynthesis C-methylase UbiE